MKTIIYNYDETDESIINNTVVRAKLLLINSDNEIGIVFSHFNYFFVGGHLEENESDYQCLEREIKEEMGVSLPINEAKKFFEVKYLNKDYPQKGKNTLSIINYYFLKTDIKPNVDNLNLTEDEKYGNFHIEYISVFDAINILNESLVSSTRPGLVNDTIEVIKEYIKVYMPTAKTIHNMHLNDDQYQLIKNKQKTIELRLRDEKRRLIKENDEIIFVNRTTNEKIRTRVKKLHMYNSFEELFTHIDKKQLGYKTDIEFNFFDMDKYYSREEQEKYGVVGIEVQLIS